jgi:hypothetical protein
MEILLTVIFATCLQPGASDYDWSCVDFINNCAVGKAGKIEQEKVSECLNRWKDGEKYTEK